MTSGSPRQSLSSMMTVFNKFIFPTICLGGFGLGIIVGSFSEPKMASCFVVVWLICFFLFYWFCFPLKSVEIDDQFLYISNYDPRNLRAGRFLSCPCRSSETLYHIKDYFDQCITKNAPNTAHFLRTVLTYAFTDVAHNFMPSALITFRTVAKSGCPSGDRAL
jgi:hypothetical protein